MKKNRLLFGFSIIILCLMYSCKKQPSYCDNPYNVNKIKLIPSEYANCGQEIIIENDSLINFFTNQLCQIEDVSWATDTRGEYDDLTIEISFHPNRDDDLFVVKEWNSEFYRYREGTTYFKNNILTEMVVQLTGIDCSRDIILNKIDTLW